MTTSSESRLESAWRTLLSEDRRALVAYLTAGHPTRDIARDALRAAAEHADVLEVGVPFSDPLADGPTIQSATFRALQGGMTLPRTLELIDSAAVDKPVVLFSYLNPVLRHGVERLVAEARDIGIAGLLLTDLPAGADPEVERAVLESDLDLIRLVAPTSSSARVRAAVQGASGFIYLVARLGVTGASSALATGLAESVARVRAETDLPIAAGFGISTPEQARDVARIADGAVVGSALVDALDQGGVSAMSTLLAALRAGIDSR